MLAPKIVPMGGICHDSGAADSLREGAHGRILLAEDNLALLQVTKFNLQRAGYDVVPATDGWEAWQTLQQEEFDAVITDEQMPRMTGRELCERMRAGEVHRNVPVIFLTSKCLELDHSRLERELGVSRVVGKPFSPRELVETVGQMLFALQESG